MEKLKKVSGQRTNDVINTNVVYKKLKVMLHLKTEDMYGALSRTTDATLGQMHDWGRSETDRNFQRMDQGYLMTLLDILIEKTRGVLKTV